MRTAPPRSRRNPSRSPASPPATPRCAPSAAPATTCTTAATTSSTSPSRREFEEIAYLLVHGKLPNAAELAGLQDEAAGRCAACPPRCRTSSSASRPPRIRWTCCAPAARCWARSCPRARTTSSPSARDIADRLMACFGSMLLYWYHFSHSGRRIEVETDDDSIGGHFLHLLHGKKPSALWVRAMHTSLILYAEHEFNASHLHRRVDRRHRLRHVLRHHRRHRRAARARSTAAPTSSPSTPSAATTTPTRPRPTSCSASPRSRSSSASATRSTRSPTRATR